MPCKVMSMKVADDFTLTRRGFLAASLIVSEALTNLTGGRLDAVAATVGMEPTPACAAPDDITPSQTAGPFFKPRSPERKSLLEPAIHGNKIVLEGRVRSTKCKPVPEALIDIWQADDNGAYDNTGYRLRGHQFADGAGRYRFETIVPGLYPGRTRHFHVRVQPPNRPILTTQLYFPGEPENKRDSIFNAKLVVALNSSPGITTANFDFVVELG
jgi:protocatechuate 3,4-dioxygenase beta subunit